MKVFNVGIQALCSIVVLAETADEALSIACNNVSLGDFEITTGGPAEEIVDDDEDNARLCYIRHANKVLDIDGREIRAKEAEQLLAT